MCAIQSMQSLEKKECLRQFIGAASEPTGAPKRARNRRNRCAFLRFCRLPPRGRELLRIYNFPLRRRMSHFEPPLFAIEVFESFSPLSPRKSGQCLKSGISDPSARQTSICRAVERSKSSPLTISVISISQSSTADANSYDGSALLRQTRKSPKSSPHTNSISPASESRKRTFSPSGTRKRQLKFLKFFNSSTVAVESGRRASGKMGSASQNGKVRAQLRASF